MFIINLFQNLSLDEAKQGLENGNEKALDSLGFGFGVDVDSEKTKEADLIEDLQRIQKDTTDFCNIQVRNFWKFKFSCRNKSKINKCFKKDTLNGNLHVLFY